MNMYDMITGFPAQIHEALELDNAYHLPTSNPPVRNVLCCGMGGSGIGSAFVAEWLRPNCPLPIQLSHRYTIPRWVDEHTLVIISSYSGNTEESLSAMAQASQQGAHLVCISSGGQLMESALTMGLAHYAIPSGWPSPRACLGYAIVTQMRVLYDFGIIPDSEKATFLQAAEKLTHEQQAIQQRAHAVAQQILGHDITIYCADMLEPVAWRWRQQFNENSKILCHHNVIPEMNHNELVGWDTSYTRQVILALRTPDESPKVSRRFDLCREIIQPQCADWLDLWSQGSNGIVRSLYMVHMGDWISYYLAEMRQVDPVRIDPIDLLKNALSQDMGE